MSKINLINLIVRYKKEIEDLKENDNFKDEKKVITVTVLRDIVFDLEQIVDKKDNKWWLEKKHIQKHLV